MPLIGRVRLRLDRALPTTPAVRVLAQEGVEYHCRLTPERARNLALQDAARRSGFTDNGSVPHIVHVGVTTFCNIHCPACPTGNGNLGRPRQHLDIRTYRQLLEQIGSRLMLLLFWDWGEPLMHPDIVTMTRLARDRDIHSIVSTSGLAGDSPGRLGTLVDAGLSYIIVCVDGASQQSYQAYRKGGRLERVLATLRKLVAARGGGRYPVIEFRSLATRHNEGEFPQLLAMAQDTGADVFGVKSLRPYDYRGIDVDHRLVPDNDRLARYRYGDGRRQAADREMSAGPLRCQKPLFAPTLNADGTLAFCSYATAPIENFGGLPEQEFDRWWQGSAVRPAQRLFLDGDGTDACRSCYFRSDHAPTMLYTVALRELPEDIRLQNPVSPVQFLEHIRRAGRRPR